MSRWISETTGLESKMQLKSHRVVRWQGLMLCAGLEVGLVCFFTNEEKSLEAKLWAETDAEYEQRKTVLRKQLNELSDIDLAIYFSEIGVKQQSIDVWLSNSLA